MKTKKEAITSICRICHHPVILYGIGKNSSWKHFNGNLKSGYASDNCRDAGNDCDCDDPRALQFDLAKWKIVHSTENFIIFKAKGFGMPTAEDILNLCEMMRGQLYKPYIDLLSWDGRMIFENNEE